MKQTILLIFSGALLSILLNSCTKNFLDKQPVSSALPNEISAEPLLAGAYQDFYNEYYTSNYIVNSDVMSDNAYAGGDNPAHFAIDKYQVTSTNDNLRKNWEQLYSAIKNCNIVLNYVPDISDPTVTETRRQEILGEASFLRAYHYFNLIRNWKEVPIILNVPGDLKEMFSKKSTTDEVYKQIITDLEFALQKVRETVPDKGVVSKGAVKALLAKVYAQKPNPDWNKVLEYCKAIESLGYDLVPDYASLFTLSGENSVESIWETQYDGSVHYNWITGMNTPFMWGDWKKFNIPSHNLIKAFDVAGDVIRKNASIKFVETSWTDDYWSQPVPVIYKYPDPDGKSNNYRIRYADIVLLRAEALTELNQIDNSINGARFWLNKIRKRVNLPNTTAITQTALRLAIEDERQLELAFEGHRMYDIIRTGRAVEIMNSQRDGSNNLLNYNVTENKLYFPLPQDELDRNPNINK